jgi:hypothetical protein
MTDSKYTRVYPEVVKKLKNDQFKDLEKMIPQSHMNLKLSSLTYAKLRYLCGDLDRNATDVISDLIDYQFDFTMGGKGLTVKNDYKLT